MALSVDFCFHTALLPKINRSHMYKFNVKCKKEISNVLRGIDVYLIRPFYFTGKTTWKYVTHEPPLLPERKTCQFVCSCNHAVTLVTPNIYDVTSDPGETTPLDPSSESYKTLSKIFIQAINLHKTSLAPVETQFSWSKILPNLRWQPCCNGVFPFNCKCTDYKFPE